MSAAPPFTSHDFTRLWRQAVSKRVFLAVLTLGVVAGWACAQRRGGGSRAPSPDGTPAPRPAVVATVDADEGVIVLDAVVQVPVTRRVPVQETREVDGREEVVTRWEAVTELRAEKRQVRWAARGNQALDVSGARLDGDQLWDRVRAGDTVLLVEGGSLDPAWRKVLKPEVVILTQTAAARPGR